MNDTTSFNIEELEGERQWLYVAIEPEIEQMVSEVYPKLLTDWESYKPDSQITLANIWDIVEGFTTAFNLTPSLVVEEFVASKIWAVKLAQGKVVSPTIAAVLSGRM